MNSKVFHSLHERKLPYLSRDYLQLPQEEKQEFRSRSTSSRRRTTCFARVGIIAVLFMTVLFTYAKYQCRSVRRARVSYALKQQNGEKHLVVASQAGQNVSWMNDIPSDWTIKRYVVDDPMPDPALGLSVPQDFAREAMAYLTYIVDHYDSLPDYAIFIHGHDQSWHQRALISSKIRALNLTALENEDYISLRCGNMMGCERQPNTDTFNTNWWAEEHIRDFWNIIIPHEEMPRFISFKCCAQFAVSRKAIHRRTKDEWIQIRSPIIRDQDEFRASEQWIGEIEPQYWSWIVGRYYEMIWHLLFGMPSEYCPSEDRCNMVHFSNAIICAGDPEGAPYDGDHWMEDGSRCATAFDGLGPDEPIDWDLWYRDLLGTHQRIREAKYNAFEAKLSRLRELEQQHTQSDKLDWLLHQKEEWKAGNRTAQKKFI